MGGFFLCIRDMPCTEKTEVLMKAGDIIFTITMIVQLFVVIYGAYYFVISMFGWSNRRTKKEPKKNDIHTFAMIVAAHNEEVVIGEMVKSLRNLDYPQQAYDIFVIADNCTDATAQVARDAGAIVYERFNDKLRGKGHALEWMFDKIYDMIDNDGKCKYDFISVFDADNLVNKEFLTEMNREINKGYDVVQGSVDSKNPFDTWITTAYSISFWMVSRFFQNARYNLNMTCQLSGTGFCVSVPLLKEIGWGATCLTEDMEFTAKLALMGKKVGWAHKAVIYDEKPLTFKASWKQRVRWMQGHGDVASRFARKLFVRSITKHDLSAFDCCVYLMQPLKIFVLGIATVFGFLTMLPTDVAPWVANIFTYNNLFSVFFGGDVEMAKPIAMTFSTLMMFYVPIVVTYERRVINLKLIWSYLIFGLYTLTWIPITIIGWCNRHKTEWSHTIHTRAMSVEDMQNNNKQK